jgi:hypothetical protein
MQQGTHTPLAARSALHAVGLRASQRMLANCVLGLCARLLRLAQERQFLSITPEMTELMETRRAMLRKLQMGIRNAAELSCVAAVSSAIAEADRGLLVMMDNSARLQREA